MHHAAFEDKVKVIMASLAGFDNHSSLVHAVCTILIWCQLLHDYNFALQGCCYLQTPLFL